MSNPLTQRLTRRARDPRPVLITGGVVGGALSAAMVLIITLSRKVFGARSLLNIGTISALIVLILCGLGIAAVTTRLVAADQRGDATGLLRLTGLDETAILQGYIRAARIRTAGLWALAAAFALPLAVILWVNALMEVGIVCPPGLVCPPLTPEAVDTLLDIAWDRFVQHGLPVGGSVLVGLWLGLFAGAWAGLTGRYAALAATLIVYAVLAMAAYIILMTFIVFQVGPFLQLRTAARLVPYALLALALWLRGRSIHYLRENLP